MKAKKDIRLFRGEKCLNCSTPLDLSDRYCNYCGQTNSTQKLAFNDFFSEFFAGLFAYDSKIYKTISALLFKPGKISLDYINGKRNTYVNPFRFYLSVSILFFIILGSTTSESDGFVVSSKQVEIESTATTAQLGSTENYATEKDLAKHKGIAAYKERFSTYYSYYGAKNISNSEKALSSLGHRTSSFNKWMYSKARNAQILLRTPAYLSIFLSPTYHLSFSFTCLFLRFLFG